MGQVKEDGTEGGKQRCGGDGEERAQPRRDAGFLCPPTS